MPQDSPAATTSASRPISPLPQPHPHLHYQSPQQQTLPIRASNPPLPKPFDPSQPQNFVFPFGSGSFGPKVRGLAASDHGVPAAYPPPSLMYSGGVRGMQLDYLSHALHMTRPVHPVPFTHLGNTTPTASPSVKKAAPRSAVSDVNGYKDTNTRERSKEDTYIVVRDRKVRIMEDASLYELCRSWLRNGIHEETQPQQKDVMKGLPKPLPASMVTNILNKKEGENDEDEQEENEKSVEHLSPQDLLKMHIKRAKKVRARLRDERLHRITRYRSRLRLLLPSPVEQFRNDTAAGN